LFVLLLFSRNCIQLFIPISKVPAWTEVQVPLATWAISLESWAAPARWTLTPAGEEPVLIDIPLWERMIKMLDLFLGEKLLAPSVKSLHTNVQACQTNVLAPAAKLSIA
jgi:hypothetical protein